MHCIWQTSFSKTERLEVRGVIVISDSEDPNYYNVTSFQENLNFKQQKLATVNQNKFEFTIKKNKLQIERLAIT